MNRWVRAALADSAYDFNRHVKGLLEAKLGGEIVSIEDEKAKSDILSRFDHHGIDAFQILEPAGMRGIASRVTYGEHDPSFTVRYAYFDGKKDVFNCEYQKKLRALGDLPGHWFFPHYTVQARCTAKRDGELQWAAYVETKDLISFIAANEGNRRLVQKKFNAKGGSKFFVVDAATLFKEGIRVNMLARR